MNLRFARALSLTAATVTLLTGCGGSGLQGDVVNGASIGWAYGGPASAAVGAVAGAVAAEVSPDKTFNCRGGCFCDRESADQPEYQHSCSHREGTDVEADDSDAAAEKLRTDCRDEAVAKKGGKKDDWNCKCGLKCKDTTGTTGTADPLTP